jgi:L-alanine-DL-glutamate epimerase-like enolase superfamily enzyme
VKVERVEAIPVAYPEPNDYDATRHLCLVKVTADGAVGWGEAVTMWPEASLAVAALIDGMAPLLVGTDPCDNVALWERLKRHAWWYGHGGGISSFAVSALDIALWDLKGQALGTSVCTLLGGPVRDRLPAIASSHAHHESLDQMADEATGWLEGGLQGMKVGFGKRGSARLGYEHDRDVEYVRRMRELLGPDRSLMIDLGVAVEWDLSTALRRLHAFEEHAVDWVEEPLGAWDPAGYAVLRQQSRTRLAYGEREWDVAGYTRVLDTGTCDVVGVDPGRAEGITGFRRVADLVASRRRQANAHAWSSAIVSAASLAVSFSSPACALFEVKPLRNPMQHDLVAEPIEHQQGWMHPPTDRSGLGITVQEDVVDHYRVR